MKKRFARRYLEESIFKTLMIGSFLIVAGSLGLILLTVVVKGLPALTLDMLTKIPQGGFYLGKEGGILNAIVGSLYLAGGATLLAMLLSLPIVLYLAMYATRSRWAAIVRLSLDAHVLEANDAVAELLGVGRADLLGVHLGTFLAEPGPGDVPEEFGRLAAGGGGMARARDRAGLGGGGPWPGARAGEPGGVH